MWISKLNGGDNMAGKNEVPRYGIHGGIKFSPKRTLVRVCFVCKSFYIPTGRSQKVCSEKCRRIYKTDYKSYWYNQLPEDKKAQIRARDERSRTFRLDTHEDILREMKQLGLR
jgi:hypothetical protein